MGAVSSRLERWWWRNLSTVTSSASVALAGHLIALL